MARPQSTPKRGRTLRQRRRVLGRPASGLERLEERTLLDAKFDTLANELDLRLGAIEAALATTVQTAASLPVLGSSLNAIVGHVDESNPQNNIPGVQTAFHDVRTKMVAAVRGLNSTDPEDVIETKLHAALDGLSVLRDVANDGTRNDVNVTKNLATGRIDVTLNVGQSVSLGGFTFDLGLPGVPLQVKSGGIDVNAGFAYDGLTFSIDGADQPLFDANGASNELRVLVGAGLKSDIEITADLGFLSVVATDQTPGVDDLTASLDVDVQGNSATGVSLGAATLNGQANVGLRLRANFATAGLASSAEYPSISTDLVMHWDLNGSNPNSPRGSLGQEPSIEFQNVTLHVGSFLSRMLGPVAATIRDFMRPADPILKIVTFEIPGLSDLSKAAGLGPVSLRSLANFVDSAGLVPPDYAMLLDLFNATTAVHELLINVNANRRSLEFNVGSFSLAGNDIRNKTLNPDGLSGVNLTNLIPVAVGTLTSINDQLADSMPNELQGVFNLINQRLRSAQNGAGFNFPLFDDPLTGVFKILLGQDVDFVNYTAQFHFDAYQTALIPVPIPILPKDIIRVRLNGQIDVDAYLKVGYDTYGLRTFLRTGNAGQLANGLYFDASKPLLTMNGRISAGLAALLPAGVVVPVGPFAVPVTPNASINGELSANDVRVSLASTSSRFRFLEAHPEPMFNTQGVIKAAFTFVVEAGIPGVATVELYKRTLDDSVLFDLDFGELSNPRNTFGPPPSQEAQTPRVLFVNMNTLRGRQTLNGQLRFSSPGNNGVPDNIQIIVSGNVVDLTVNGIRIQRERLDRNLVEARIIGSEDDDTLTVDGRFNRPVTYKAGLGANRLVFDDRGWGGTGTAHTYTITSDLVKRRTTDSLGRFVLGEIPVSLEKTKLLTVYTTSLSSASVSVSDLNSTDLTLALGRTENFVTIDTTNGGWADRITLTSPVMFPIRPLGPTHLTIRDQTAANDPLRGKSDYVVGEDQIVRKKFLPLKSANPRVGIGGTGTATIDYSAIRLSDLSIFGGDDGNTIDLQSTLAASQYRFFGGAGKDDFIVGQVHHTLDGGTGQERQLGFSAVRMNIEGRGGLDSLTLDDSGSDFLHYPVHNTYDVHESFVGYTSNQTMPDGVKTVRGEYFFTNVENLTIKAGGTNTYNVNNTPSLLVNAGTSQFPILIETAHTTIIGGNKPSTLDQAWVNRTTGPLEINGRGGLNQYFVGAFGTGLDPILGGIVVRGPGGDNWLDIDDSGSTASHDYLVEPTFVKRNDRRPIAIRDLTRLTLRAGQAYDQIIVNDTPASAFNTIATVGGDDYVAIAKTTRPLTVVARGSSYIDVGNNISSLDNIQGPISISAPAANNMTLVLNDTAATAWQSLTADTSNGQTYSRLGAAPIRSTFGALRNFVFYGGSGGATSFVYGTAPGTFSDFVGYAGALDTFQVGFPDMNQILGVVRCWGQAADNDFAYYYDYLNPSSQAYTISTNVFLNTMFVERAGIAPVQYGGLGQVIFYAPKVGDNKLNVRGVVAPTLLNAALGAGDVVTVGDQAPNLGGSLAGILGPINLGSYALDGGVDGPLLADVTLILDNSGNADMTPRRATLGVSPLSYDYYAFIEGLAPAGIYWDLGPLSSVQILGGAADETFALKSPSFVTPISINGGGGTNSLDYISVWDQAITPIEDGGLGEAALNGVDGLVSLYRADGNASDAIGGNHGTLVGDTTFSAGKAGQAFRLDGDGDYVQVTNAVSLEPTTVSVEAWVNSTHRTAHGEYDYILAKGAAEFRGASYALVTSIDSGLWFYVGNGSAFQYSPDPGAGIWDGNWHHVVGTYDGSYVRLYVDGVEVGNGARLDNILGYGLPTSNDLYIGTYGGIAGYSFDGLIDGPAVYNRALSPAEVQTLFATGSGGSALQTGVYVNLQQGQATGLVGGVVNIQNVIGTSGDDILVGNGGNVLIGGAGRDLLIAGATPAYSGDSGDLVFGGSSQLYGGDGEDLLIGGFTSYDRDQSQLEQILADWTSADGYGVRAGKMRAWFGAGKVIANGGGNTLFGERDVDLFFASASDLTDALEDEDFNWL